MSSTAVLATSFLDAALRLEASDQARSLDFARQFLADPSHPSIRLEKLHRGTGWSGRISRELRAIIHQVEGAWALVWVDHHDDAYQWAERHQVERHPITGSLQLVETEIVVREVERVVEKWSEAPLFHDRSDAYLLSLGVPPSWLPTVREIRGDDGLLRVVEKLPPDVGERLLELADGQLVTPPVPIPPDHSPLESADSRRSFLPAEDEATLEAILAAPLERWIAFLHPSQKELVEGEYRGPVRVSGAAGTGKTVVALHRARHLSRQGHRVLLTSFVKTLCQNLQRSLDLLCTKEECSRIETRSLHSVALELVRKVESRAHPVPQRQITDSLETFRPRYAPDFDDAFVRAEWENVIEQQGIVSWDEYRSARRTGRGRPLAVRQRRDLWRVFEATRENLGRRGGYTYPGLCRRAADLLSRGEVVAPYEAVVVDEIQDLKPPDLMLVRELAATAPGRLMLVGDMGQRIFAGGLSLAALGIETRGRSRILRLNYRTTEQIRRAADQVLGTVVDLDEEDADRRSRSLLAGPEPLLRGYGDSRGEALAAVARVRAWIADGIRPEEVGVFARSQKRAQELLQALEAEGVAAQRLKDDHGAELSAVVCGTMHRAKGLEFKAVLAVSCSEGEIPNPRSLSKFGDPLDREQAEAADRSLLYVVMTRARDRLAVTWAGRPSPLLVDLVKTKTAGGQG